ncbi:hypothetical protein NECID01_1596 [Nematocida sp. AWRm77]|nr:hypothetical protein NECID01_1596 [Nematocida sp. AWRm77]
MEQVPVVQCLAMHYLNEKGVRRVLPYNEDLVERVVFLLGRQKQRLASVENTNKTLAHVYKIEIERVEWMLTEYLQIRLEKIRENFYLEEENNLSVQEKEYRKAYLALKAEENVYIPEQDIPDRFKTQERQKRAKTEYAGIYVLEDLPDMKIDTEILTLTAGDFLIADISEIYEIVENLSVIIA